jgi:hypothetical protein
MRAKANINYQGQPMLVDCIPYKIGYIEGFLHKDFDHSDKWNYSDFATGMAAAWNENTMEDAIAWVERRVADTTEERYRELTSVHPVINTNYVDYVPRVGDLVMITKPERPIRWGGDMDNYIGVVGKILRTLSYSEVEGAGDVTWTYEDGDFRPVNCLPSAEPVATIRFITEGGRELPQHMVSLGERLVELTGVEWCNDFRHSMQYPQICSDRFKVYGWEGNYRAYMVEGYTNIGDDFVSATQVLDFVRVNSPDLPQVKKAVIKPHNLTFSGSFLDFLHTVKDESRIARIILSVRDLQYKGIGSLIDNVLTADEINYLTFRGDNGNISYLPKGKEHKVTTDGKWMRDGRQDGKPGKVMRKIFTKAALKLFKETDFEIFNNKFKAKFTDGFKFDILPASEIPNVYLDDNRSEDGSLGGSCMRDVSSDYFDIYTHCKHLRIVTLRDKEGVLHGRALLWNVLIDNEEATFIDRFYVSKDSLYEKFVEFAIDKGFYYKQYYKTYDSKTLWVAPDGTKVDVGVTIKTPTDFGCYPYIDTFSYGDDGSLNNFGDGRYTYNNAEGTRDGDGLIDDITGDRIEEDESVCIDRGRYEGYRTHVDNATEVDGEWWWCDEDKIMYCEETNQYELAENVVSVNGSTYLHDSDQIVFCSAGQMEGEYILRDEAYEVNGKIYHEDDVNKL